MSEKAKKFFSFSVKDEVAEIDIFDKVIGWDVWSGEFKAQFDDAIGKAEKVIVNLNSPGGNVTEGLAISQKDKLASLAENVEFDSEENYREKLVSLKESYFPNNTSAQRDESETISEDTDVQETLSESVSPRMEAYLQTLGRVAKK